MSFKTKIFADGADLGGMLEMYKNPLISGFTTNPTLMRKAGISDYPAFAKEVVDAIPDRPISFEVFSDDLEEMEKQANMIASWGDNVYVKIPITNTQRVSTAPLIGRLSAAGIKVNVTALMTNDQTREVLPSLIGGPASNVSIFAGRVADTGIDPLPLMIEAVELLRPYPHIELIWASPREVFNLRQADNIGCQIITMTNDLIKKIALFGKDLDQYSLETVEMFDRDAKAAGFTI